MEQRILRKIIIALVTALGAEIQPLILQKTEGTSGGFFILKGIRTRREQTFTASVLPCVIGGSSIILFIEN